MYKELGLEDLYQAYESESYATIMAMRSTVEAQAQVATINVVTALTRPMCTLSKHLHPGCDGLTITLIGLTLTLTLTFYLTLILTLALSFSIPSPD